MSESRSSRPRQVTFAAWLIIGGSLFVLVSAFEQMAGVQSLETRKAVESFLAEPPADTLGLGVKDVLDALRVMVLVTGACATAIAILGFSALKRSRSARLALSILAVPLFVSGLVVGGIMSSFVAAAVVMLWVQPARDWFAGREPAATTRDARFDRLPPSSQAPYDAGHRPGASQAPPTVSAPWDQPSGQTGEQDQPGQQQAEPRAWSGYGTAGTGSVGAPVTYPPAAPPAPQAQQGPGFPAAPRGRRPAPLPVVWACVLTWVTTGLVASGMGLTALALAFAPDPLFEELDRRDPALLDGTGMSQDDLRVLVLAVAVGIVVWCVLAALLAVLAFRGAKIGRTLLLISATLSALVCLVGTVLGSLLLVVPLAACAGTVALLGRPEVGSWYTER